MELQPLTEKKVPLAPQSPSEFSSHSFWSRVFFWWVWRVVRTAKQSQIQAEETERAPHSLLPEHLTLPEDLKTSRLLPAILRSQKWYLWLALVLKVCSSFLSFTGPFYIKQLSIYLTEEDKPLTTGLWLLGTYAVLNFLSVLLGHNGGFIEAEVQNRVKTGLNLVVYNKALRTPIAEGQGVNLVQVDARKVYEFFSYAIGLVCMPTELCLAIYFIYAEVGVSVGIGIGILLTVFGVNYLMSKQIKTYNEAILQLKDQRLSLSKETFSEIRLIKACSWEDYFEQKIKAIRDAELQKMRWLYFLWSVNIFIFWTSPVLTTASVFLFYTQVLGHSLTAEKAFVTLSALVLLQGPLRELPFAFTRMIQAYVSVRRIQDVVDLPENPPIPCDKQVSLENCSLSYGEVQTLHNISLTLVPGEFLAVVGPVGSGKSSLLNAILGEMTVNSGSIVSTKDLSYAPSLDSWLMNDTLRNNVLMGNAFREDWYWKVLAACGLMQDLEVLPGGDLTEIGEKGINLSGGQKARVNLARAVYADARTILLDDPLSSVDTQVADHIMTECLCKLLSEKTRVLVTHRREHLKHVDRVIVMEAGRIVDITYPTESILSQDKDVSEVPEEDVVPSSEAGLTAEEEREAGKVDKRVYYYYFQYAGSLFFVLLVILVMSLWTATIVTGDIYLKEWTESPEDSQLPMLLYCGIKIGGCFFIFCRSFLVLNVIGVRVSRKIHEKLVNSLLSAPVNLFYDITPSGRVLNRLSKDQNEIDELPLSLGALMAHIFSASATLVIQTIYFPWILLSVLLLAYCSVKIAGLFLGASRELRRLEAVSTSNVLNLLGEAMSGGKFIRCFRKQEYFTMKNNRVLAENIRLSYNLIGLGGWQVVYLGFLSTAYVTFMFAVMITFRHQISAGTMGLCMAYSIGLPGSVMTTIFTFVGIENNMIAVERAHAYSLVPPELPRTLPTDPTQWPVSPSVKFDNVNMRYRPNTPLVLKNLSFTIEAGQRVGLIGRTGSGKTSVFASLLRLVELTSGRILIGGVDIASLGLATLRKAITLIPQDPIVFEGTIGNNLDPLGLVTPAQVEQVLQEVGLTQFTYEQLVAAKGSNLSVGERQLLSIARALLTKRKVVLLDEATAGIDTAADKAIQAVIRSRFERCTLLVIAHRLETIQDNDLILVLNNGNLLDSGIPQKILPVHSDCFPTNESL